MFNIQGLCPHGSCLSQTRCRGFTDGHYKLFIAPFTVIIVFFFNVQELASLHDCT